MTKLAILLSDI